MAIYEKQKCEFNSIGNLLLFVSPALKFMHTASTHPASNTQLCVARNVLAIEPMAMTERKWTAADTRICNWNERKISWILRTKIWIWNCLWQVLVQRMHLKLEAAPKNHFQHFALPNVGCQFWWVGADTMNWNAEFSNQPSLTAALRQNAAHIRLQKYTWIVKQK